MKQSLKWIRLVILLMPVSIGIVEARYGKAGNREISPEAADMRLFRYPRNIGDNDRFEGMDGLQEEQEQEQEDIDTGHVKEKGVFEYLILPPGYNKYKIPFRSGGAKPLEIDLSMVIYKVLDFDEINQQMVLYLDISVSWVDLKILDFRLNDTSGNMKPGKAIEDMTPEEFQKKIRIINSPNVLTSIWKPNLIFEDLISIKQPYVMARPVKLKVIPEAGYIEYITRMSVAIDCGMEFEYYPADTQTCAFSIRPFSYTSKLVRLKWKDTGIFLVDTTLPSFDVRVDDLHEKFTIDDYNYPEIVFDVLGFTVYVRRKLSYHLVQTYLASVFYIIITCLCFLLPPRMVEARIGISMTTLLTLTAMFASVRESTPITSYVKAIDSWMVYCIFFVFLTLSQFTFYTWLRGMKEDTEEDSKEKEADKKLPEQQSLLQDGSIEMNEVEIKSGSKPRRKSSSLAAPANASLPSRWERYEKIAYFIERFSFPIFLSIFAAFAAVYWIWLLHRSDYFNWTVNATINNLDEN